jgi:hypothetical protein
MKPSGQSSVEHNEELMGKIRSSLAAKSSVQIPRCNFVVTASCGE